jgi:NADPH2:quinone reductase
MRAVGMTKFGGPEVLRTLDLPAPHAGPGEVRIKVAAASVCPADVLFRTGALAHRLTHTSSPWVPGSEVAGVIDECGPDSRWRLGDAVMAVVVPYDQCRGAYADHVVVPEDSIAAVRPDCDLSRAAAVPMSGLTALVLLDLLDVTSSQSIAIVGSGGVVGGLLIQLASVRGATILVDAAADDGDRLRGLGADHVVERGSDYARQIRSILPEGADVVVDAANVGAATLTAVRDRGAYASLREPDGATTERACQRKITSLYARVWDFIDGKSLQRLAELMDDGRLVAPAVRLFAPEDADQAHRLLESGGARARPVLDFRATPGVSLSSTGANTRLLG